MNRLNWASISCVVALACAASGCVSGDEAILTAPAVATLPPEQMLAAVDAAAGPDDREVSVQPLRDPQVEDLRQDAERAVQSRDYPAAAEALNQALLIAADQPDILQARAEVALLQSDFQRAETLARRAFDLGSKVGPLCRRHWASIEQARLARGLKDDAASARVQIDACTVAGFNRM